MWGLRGRRHQQAGERVYWASSPFVPDGLPNEACWGGCWPGSSHSDGPSMVCEYPKAPKWFLFVAYI